MEDKMKRIRIFMMICVLIAGGLWAQKQSENQKSMGKDNNTPKNKEKPSTKAKKRPSKTFLKVERTIVVLKKAYRERKKKEDYHKKALEKISRLLRQAEMVKSVFEKKKSILENIKETFGGEVPPKKLAQRVFLMPNELPIIDRYSEALNEWEKSEKAVEESDEKLSKMKGRLKTKKIERLETEVKLGGKEQ
jgi:predicted RND superfamily exporter protein